jgi:hypothetical protein
MHLNFAFASGFCKIVGRVIVCGYIIDRYFLVFYCFTNEMVSNIDMFHACMELVVFLLLNEQKYVDTRYKCS